MKFENSIKLERERKKMIETEEVGMRVEEVEEERWISKDRKKKTPALINNNFKSCLFFTFDFDNMTRGQISQIEE